MTTAFSSPIYGLNFNDQFDLQAITAAHNKACHPAILMLSANAIAFSRLTYLLQLFQAARAESKVRLYLQLDHGHDIDLIKECINIGFDLVMADFSSEDLESNISKTREVVDLAHKVGIMVEGGLGIIPTLRSEGQINKEHLTRPESVSKFVEQTGVDLLAISVGNVHGVNRQKPSLNIELIKAIGQELRVPLVLHGADFYSNSVLHQAFQNGIIKANLGPELRRSYVEALRSSIVRQDMTDHRPVLNHARQAVERIVLGRLKVLTAYKSVVSPVLKG